MLSRVSLFALALVASVAALPSLGQTADTTPPAATAATTIPNLIHFAGALPAVDGKLEPAEATITFLVYKDKQGGEPLWMESQQVAVDKSGHYEVHLGATSANGLPGDLFASGEARWLEVQVAGGKPETRTLLVSVPYAMKAADAATLGGLPASAFVLAGTKAAEAQLATPAPETSAAAVTTPGGTAGYLPVYSGATTIDDSVIFESGTKIGVGTNAPAATLDVNGAVDVRGALGMESSGAATTAGGKNSEPLEFTASAYNSSAKAAVAPLFALQAEPSGNDTTTPTGTLNLLYGLGGAPAETGLSISSKGVIKFATGQIFPGASTITGVTTASPLTGSGTTGSIALGLNLTALETTLNGKYPQLAVANRFTAATTFAAPVTFAATQTFPGTGKGSITGVTTTSPLAGSGTSGSVALSLNLTALETTLNTKYPQLAVANKFTAATTFAAPVTFAATQTFPGTGKGTITGVTTTSPLAGSGTSGSVALSLNLSALETTLNTKYPQLATANKFTAATTFAAPVTFAATQTFPGTGKGTITGVTTTSPLTGSGTTGSVALGLNLTALETTLNTKYPQLATANKFTAPTTFASAVAFASPVTFAAGQTFPGIAGGGTITGITTASPLAGSGTKGSIALSLNVTALETTLNAKYAQLGAVNAFTQPITFAAGQKFPGTTTITAVTAGSGLTGGGTTGAIKLALDPSVIPTLTSSPVFTNSGNGIVGDASGTVLNTAGVLGEAGTRSGVSHVVAGIWGDSYGNVGVEGTSVQTVGVYGQSTVSYGVEGVSTSNNGVLGTSNSGTGVSGLSTSSSGVAGYTAGGTLNTAGVLGLVGSRTGFAGISGVWGDSVQHVGVFGSSNQYAGVQGSSTTAPGVQGNSTSNNGVHGISQSTSGIFGETSSTSGQDAGVFGYSHANSMGVYGSSVSGLGVVGSSSSNIGVQGSAGDGGIGVRAAGSTGYGVYASTTSGEAVLGSAQTGLGGLFDNDSNSSAALMAQNYASWQGGANAYPISVFGNSTGNVGVGVEGNSPTGIGVYGIGGSSDSGIHTNSNVAGRVIGVWGDTTGVTVDGVMSPVNAYAVMGTSSNSTAGYFQSNSLDATVYAYNYSSGSGDTLYQTFAAATPGGSCGFGGSGDLTCTGQVKALATSADGAHTVETYSMQSPENWMEDFGSGNLESGAATITIDPAFAGTVEQAADYHVFLTPNGDSKGLYVVAKTATSFEVHESGGGRSTLSFDYRIVAKRRGFKGQRMTDVTEKLKAQTARIAQQAKAISPDRGAR